jgi:lysophospholipase L1-like esterase
LAIVCAVTAVFLEIALRIKNPIYVPLRADEIQLPVNRVLKQVNANNPKVDELAVAAYNAIGLRGPNYPEQPDKFIKIFTVGGSTTNCVRLTDGRTWPDLLATMLVGSGDKKIWLNNAGMDGHSTFGHQILLQSHLRKYKPDYIIYLVGINDMERKDLTNFEVTLIRKGQPLRDQIVAASELLSTLQVLKRSWMAYDLGVNSLEADDLTKLPVVHMNEAQRAGKLRMQREQYLSLFRRRVESLLSATRAAGARPILVTQPGLMGHGVDPTTGVRLDDLEYRGLGIPSSLKWDELELYNDVLRDIAAREDILLIDAAREMPKDSRYYFDWIHYSNSGAALMAHIIRPGVQAEVDNFDRRRALTPRSSPRAKDSTEAAAVRAEPATWRFGQTSASKALAQQ